MIRFSLGLVLLAGIGCTNFQPVGPLARHQSSSAGSPDGTAPAIVSAAKPVPPALLIVPDEVNADNASSAAQKLANEFEYDWKSIPPPPRTAEVSRYRNGVKQN